MNRPKSSSQLLAGRTRSRSSVITTTTSPLNGNGGTNGKAVDRKGRATSARREEKLPSLAKINKEIMDKSAELLGQKGMEPQTLVDWIQDKRGEILAAVVNNLPTDNSRQAVLYLYEVWPGQVHAYMAPIPVPGYWQHCHALKADLLHAESGWSDTVQPG